MDNGVDAYIKKQRSPQKEVCAGLRKLVLKTFPGIKEEMNMGVPWYEGRLYIVSLKDHVNLGVSVEGLSKDELALFTGKGKTMRHVEFFSVGDIEKKHAGSLLKIAKKSKCSCPPKRLGRKTRCGLDACFRGMGCR
ncbi:MAG: DUF1801 domain-containing protein [Candidatus Micrarchaeia archaeon]|jgi:hypothetical protein